MRILFLAAEVAPFAKVGGLADVAGSLPLALAALGHDVRVVMPRYGQISPERYGLNTIINHIDVPIGIGITGAAVLEGRLPTKEGGPQVPIYFIQNQHHFERDRVYGYDDDGDRFIVYCRAAMIMLKALDWRPDIMHANDWHTALCINYLKTIYNGDPFFYGTRSAFTIHNLAYQGIFYGDGFLRQAGLSRYGIIWGDRDNNVNMMGRAIALAGAVSTVSPTYASEILTPEYGEKLEWLLNDRWGHLWGILNGIDYEVFNPSTDKNIAAKYSAARPAKKAVNKADLQQIMHLPVEPNIPIISMVSRLADMKGFDLVAAAAERMLAKGFQLVVLGTGEYHYHEFLWWLANRFPNQVGVSLNFDAALAQKIYAGSDFFLMPSRFEPCGLGQLIAMRYGTVPIVRYTGGLADTVQEHDTKSGYGNGFVFGPYEDIHMLSAMDRALSVYHQPDKWKKLVQINMKRDYSWENSAHQYLDFYRQELGAF